MENDDLILNEPLQPDYEKAEMDLLRDALNRTPAQRFEMMTRLMKINFTLRKAKITHKPLSKRPE